MEIKKLYTEYCSVVKSWRIKSYLNTKHLSALRELQEEGILIIEFDNTQATSKIFNK